MKELILFFVPFIAGLLAYVFPKLKNTNFKLLLLFAVSYLFAITIAHILPEINEYHIEIKWIALCMILGFFLQWGLEHVVSAGNYNKITHPHSSYTPSALSLFFILCVHAFLEGMLIAQPLPRSLDFGNTILFGVLLHRAPVAFTMVAVFSKQIKSFKKIIIYLIVFSLVAPLGLWMSRYMVSTDIIFGTRTVFLYALMGGSFLYIPIVIMFETYQNRCFQIKKILTIIVGILTVVVMEYVV